MENFLGEKKLLRYTFASTAAKRINLTVVTVVLVLAATLIPASQDKAQDISAGAGQSSVASVGQGSDQVIGPGNRFAPQFKTAFSTTTGPAQSPKRRTLTAEEQAHASAAVQQAQARYAATASPEDYAKAKSAFEEMRKQLESRKSGDASSSSTTATLSDWWCVPLYKWELEAFAWLIIIEGGVEATAALFVDATVIGIPLGTALGALGIWSGITGSGLLWWADTYYVDESAWVCL